MAKRISGPPRRPRNPVAKAVRSPRFKMQVVPDKRRKETERRSKSEAEPEPEEPAPGMEREDDEPAR